MSANIKWIGHAAVPSTKFCKWS